MLELVFAYVAGLLTLLNPCVLPILPIVLAASLQADPRGPLALAGGMSLSFVAFGLFVIVFGASIGLDQRTLAHIGAGVMILFGAVMLIPRLSEGFAAVTGSLAGRADAQLSTLEATGRVGGLGGQFLIGALLGAVWSPCIGPTLGGAIALASQGESVAWAGAIMSFFAFGISTIILALGFGAKEIVARRRDRFRQIAGRAKPILAVTFIAVGLAILSGADRWLESRVLDLLPIWLQDLSVSV